MFKSPFCCTDRSRADVLVFGFCVCVDIWKLAAGPFLFSCRVAAVILFCLSIFVGFV